MSDKKPNAGNGSQNASLDKDYIALYPKTLQKVFYETTDRLTDSTMDWLFDEKLRQYTGESKAEDEGNLGQKAYRNTETFVEHTKFGQTAGSHRREERSALYDFINKKVIGRSRAMLAEAGLRDDFVAEAIALKLVTDALPKLPEFLKQKGQTHHAHKAEEILYEHFDAETQKYITEQVIKTLEMGNQSGAETLSNLNAGELKKTLAKEFGKYFDATKLDVTQEFTNLTRVAAESYNRHFPKTFNEKEKAQFLIGRGQKKNDPEAEAKIRIDGLQRRFKSDFNLLLRSEQLAGFNSEDAYLRALSRFVPAVEKITAMDAKTQKDAEKKGFDTLLYDEIRKAIKNNRKNRHNEIKIIAKEFSITPKDNAFIQEDTLQYDSKNTREGIIMAMLGIAEKMPNASPQFVGIHASPDSLKKFVSAYKAYRTKSFNPLNSEGNIDLSKIPSSARSGLEDQGYKLDDSQFLDFLEAIKAFDNSFRKVTEKHPLLQMEKKYNKAIAEVAMDSFLRKYHPEYQHTKPAAFPDALLAVGYALRHAHDNTTPQIKRENLYEIAATKACDGCDPKQLSGKKKQFIASLSRRIQAEDERPKYTSNLATITMGTLAGIAGAAMILESPPQKPESTPTTPQGKDDTPEPKSQENGRRWAKPLTIFAGAALITVGAVYGTRALQAYRKGQPYNPFQDTARLGQTIEKTIKDIINQGVKNHFKRGQGAGPSLT